MGLVLLAAPLDGWAVSLLALHHPSVAQGSAGTSRPWSQGVPAGQPGLPPPKWAAASGKERQEPPRLSLLFSHNQNYPVVFRVITPWALLRAAFCLGRLWVWLHSWWHRREPQDGTKLLSWKKSRTSSTCDNLATARATLMAVTKQGVG